MLTGNITSVQAPDYKDNYGNSYQNITVTDANGQPTRGRIASKIPYTLEDVGSQGQWDVEQKQNNQGSYLRFKRHTDYQGGQYPPQSTSQRPQQPRGGTNDSDMVRIRSMALAYAKDLVVASKIDYAVLPTAANEFTAYIMTGRWIQDNPSQQESSLAPPDNQDEPW